MKKLDISQIAVDVGDMELNLSKSIDMENIQMNVNQAYRAMFYFLAEEYNINPSEDIIDLLSSISWDFRKDGLPSDPAVAAQWKEAVFKALKKKE